MDLSNRLNSCSFVIFLTGIYVQLSKVGGYTYGTSQLVHVKAVYCLLVIPHGLCALALLGLALLLLTQLEACTSSSLQAHCLQILMQRARENPSQMMTNYHQNKPDWEKFKYESHKARKKIFRGL
jgi:hypothetical protein